MHVCCCVDASGAAGQDGRIQVADEILEELFPVCLSVCLSGCVSGRGV